MKQEQAEIQERLLDPNEFDEEEYCSKARERETLARRRLRQWTLINVVVSILLATGFMFQLIPPKPRLNELLKQTSYYCESFAHELSNMRKRTMNNPITAPVLGDVEIPLRVDTIDGGIAKSTKHSIARLHPGPIANEAWERFEDIKTVVLSEADIRKLGKDPQTAARFPDEDWHLGDSAYMGQLDVIHQIHCLNQLRFRAFADYYPSNRIAEERRRPEWSWVHLQHCVSILLENLMCNANTEILTLNWIEEADYPFPDFSVNRQCRDFDALLKWQEDHAVDPDKTLSMKKPMDSARVIKGEAEWWNLFDGDGEALFAEHYQHHHAT